MPARLLVIEGHVQGVYFRRTTKEVADKLDVTGWVRNTTEGTVEIHAEGADATLGDLVEWCGVGPEQAHVDSVEVKEVDEEGYTTFEIPEKDA